MFFKSDSNFFFRLLFVTDRPESSLTVASECSSTISSEGEAGAVSKEGGSDPPEGPPKAPPSPTNSSISDDEDVDGGDTWNTPTNQSTPIKDLNSTSEAARAGSTSSSSSATAVKVEDKKSNGGRFASLFNNMKIPKFRLKSNKDSGSEPSSLETTPVKSSLKEKPTFSRSNSAMSTDLSSGGAGGSFVRNTKVSFKVQIFWEGQKNWIFFFKKMWPPENI